MILWHLCYFQQTTLPLVVDEGPTLDIGLCLVRHFHDKFGRALHPQLSKKKSKIKKNQKSKKNFFAVKFFFLKFFSSCQKFFFTVSKKLMISRSTVAPKLSMLDMNKISFPLASNPSRIPDLLSAPYTSPWPGGYHQSFLLSHVSGHGSNVSLRTRGNRDWLKVRIVTGDAAYFWIIFCVSSCVLNEFIKINGTSHPYVSFSH